MRLALIGLAATSAGAAACDDSISATIAPYMVPCHEALPPPPRGMCWLITDDGGEPRQSHQWFRDGLAYTWGEELRVRYHVHEPSSDDPCGPVLVSCLALDDVVARTTAAAGTPFELSLPAVVQPWLEATATGLTFYTGIETACAPAICQDVLAFGATAFDVQFELTGDLAVPLRVVGTTP